MPHTAKKIVANAFIFTGTLVLQKIISFTYFWFLSDSLKPDQLGIYIWALSLTSIFSIGVDLGLSPLLTREASRDSERAEKLLRSAIGLKIMFSVLTLALLALVLTIYKPDAITVFAVSMAGVVMIFDSFSLSFYSVLRSRQNVSYESFGMLMFNIYVFVAGVYLLGIANSPLSAVAALAFGSVINFCYSWAVVRFKFKFRTWPSFDKETAVSFLKLLPAFAAAGIFGRIYNVADSVLLGFISGKEAVGLYSVPAKVVTALQVLVPGAIIASIYPAMSYYYKNSRIMLERVFERTVGYLLAIVIPMTAGLLIVIPRVLDVVWPAYQASETAFFIMALGLPFLFLTFPTGYLLNACDRQRVNTSNRVVITMVNISLNLVLIPFIGIRGAAISFLLANILLFILDWRNARLIVPFDWGWTFSIILKSGLGSLIMIAAMFFILRYSSLPVSIIVGCLVYTACLFMFKIISKDELKMIREITRRPSEPEIISTEL